MGNICFKLPDEPSDEDEDEDELIYTKCICNQDNIQLLFNCDICHELFFKILSENEQKQKCPIHKSKTFNKNPQYVCISCRTL